MKNINDIISESIAKQDPAILAANQFIKFISEYNADEIDGFVEVFMDEISNGGKDDLLLRAFELYINSKK